MEDLHVVEVPISVSGRKPLAEAKG
jgi:hypothetical protein